MLSGLKVSYEKETRIIGRETNIVLFGDLLTADSNNGAIILWQQLKDGSSKLSRRTQNPKASQWYTALKFIPENFRLSGER